MRTSKPFSTISYNTTDFLFNKLSELISRRVIEFFAFIEHMPEQDELKAHKHLFIIPNGRIETDQVKDFLSEFDPSMPEKPLGIIMCRSSKFDDWYLYSLHDGDYLATKGQNREYHYTPDDFAVSDPDYMLELVHLIDYAKIKRATIFREAVENRVPFGQLLYQGAIPIAQTVQYQRAYNEVYNFLDRQGRKTHTPRPIPDEPTPFDE